MKHVGASIAATALLLGGATDADARAVVSLIETAAVERLALEAQQGAQLIAKDADHTAAEARERQVRAAWIKWYTEALRETLSLPLASASAELKRDVENAIARLQRQ
jgi:hypothetical protein